MSRNWKIWNTLTRMRRNSKNTFLSVNFDHIFDNYTRRIWWEIVTARDEVRASVRIRCYYRIDPRIAESGQNVRWDSIESASYKYKIYFILFCIQFLSDSHLIIMLPFWDFAHEKCRAREFSDSAFGSFWEKNSDSTGLANFFSSWDLKKKHILKQPLILRPLIKRPWVEAII